MVFEFISNISSITFNTVTDFFTLVLVILYVIVFFVIQYYLYKGYKFVFTWIYSFDPIKNFIDSFVESKLNRFKKPTIEDEYI